MHQIDTQTNTARIREREKKIQKQNSNTHKTERDRKKNRNKETNEERENGLKNLDKMECPEKKKKYWPLTRECLKNTKSHKNAKISKRDNWLKKQFFCRNLFLFLIPL